MSNNYFLLKYNSNTRASAGKAASFNLTNIEELARILERYAYDVGDNSEVEKFVVELVSKDLKLLGDIFKIYNPNLEPWMIKIVAELIEIDPIKLLDPRVMDLNKLEFRLANLMNLLNDNNMRVVIFRSMPGVKRRHVEKAFNVTFEATRQSTNRSILRMQKSIDNSSGLRGTYMKTVPVSKTLWVDADKVYLSEVDDFPIRAIQALAKIDINTVGELVNASLSKNTTVYEFIKSIRNCGDTTCEKAVNALSRILDYNSMKVFVRKIEYKKVVRSVNHDSYREAYYRMMSIANNMNNTYEAIMSGGK